MSAQLNDYDAGAAIAERLAAGAEPARTSYCAECGKSVAHVVAHSGALWLFSPGGRVGSAATLVSELEGTRDDYANDSAPEAVAIHEAFARFAEQARAANARNIAPPIAMMLTPEVFAWGSLDRTVACRGCRTWVEVSLSPALDLSPARRVPPRPV